MGTTLLLSGWYLTIAIAGLLATAIMTVFTMSFSQCGLLSVSAVEAVGSSITGRLDRARSAGLAFHLLAGIFFAYIYAFILSSLHLLLGPQVIFCAATLGMIHGYLVSFFVVISIGENSHWEQFREAGISLALVYLGAHIVYGFVLGTIFYASQLLI